MAFTKNQSAVAELYIAALGRPSEKAGLDYWVGRLESTGADALTIEEIQDALLDPATSSEVAARFPADQSNSDYVEAIYLNVFERASDAGGKAFWEERIATEGKAAVLAEMLAVAKSFANDALILSTNLAEAQAQYDEEAALLPAETEESSIVQGDYETQDLGLGFSLYVEKSDYSTYSYSYDSSTKTLTQTGDYGQEQRIFNSNNQEIKNIYLDENGNIEYISNYSYNNQNQIISVDTEFYESGIKIGNSLMTNTWSEDQITSESTFTYDTYGTFNSSALGIGLNSNNTDPLIWKIDENNDGVYDSISYYTYDAYGNEIKTEEDYHADGVIDNVVTTDWLLLV